MTRKIAGILIFGILLIVTIFATIKHNSKSPGYKPGTFNNTMPHSVSMTVFETEDEKGWGYEVFIDTSLFIHQDFIPAVSGTKSFSSQSDAKKCGNLVVSKILKNKLPSVSVAELDSLGIAY